MSIVVQLLLAMCLDAVAGEPKWIWQRVPHPAVLMGRIVGHLDAALNRTIARRAAGVLALIMMVYGAAAIGWLVSQFGAVVTILVAAILLAQRSLVEHVQAVADGLRLSDDAGREAVRMIVSRDVSDAPPDAIARAGLESLAENFGDGVIAPAFWFLIGGLPGLMVYKMVNTADSMIGYRTPRHEAFGWAAARFDDLLNWIPARLTALLLASVGGWPSWRRIKADAALHRSPNAGWPEAAMAHALNFALAGPRSYHGTVTPFAWVNADGKHDLGPADIDAGIRLVWKAWGAAAALLIMIGGLIWLT
ncbi:adenosylcobinamide-phosphate synthase CbiB [Tateyamaria sp. SN6-1]|uniref:adenosylcobinamide-phosphate synthase CbiB n=1 Tax=Tateyamaria sp. SN6-1 TaxID=3092148 RepID=UPI0039F44ADD